MISRPLSLSRLDPGLPIQITRHCTVKKPSSQSTSTTCPISNRKPPRNLKPRCELSTTMQGSRCARPLRLTIKLVRFLMAVRFDRLGKRRIEHRHMPTSVSLGVWASHPAPQLPGADPRRAGTGPRWLGRTRPFPRFRMLLHGRSSPPLLLC